VQPARLHVPDDQWQASRLHYAPRFEHKEVISMDTSRVSRRLAVFAVVMGLAVRWTVAHEPTEEVPAPKPLPAVAPVLPSTPDHVKPQSGELADVLFEIREHLGPSVLEGTMFQIGGPGTIAWVFGPGKHDEMERMAFMEHVCALAAGEPATCPLSFAGQACSASTAACTAAVAAKNATCSSCTHQASVLASQASMQTAATVEVLRGAARELELAAGEIEDHAERTVEGAKLAWKQSDELREIARSLREKANSTFSELASHYPQTSVSQQVQSTSCGENCATTGQTSVAVSSKQCGPNCDCQSGKTGTVAVDSDCEAQASCSELPILTKLPYLSRLFPRVDAESCEAKAPREYGVPVAPGARLFTRVVVVPPAHAEEAAPTPAELETVIEHLTDELNELRNQLRAQTSRRAAAERAAQQ
jgi:hypothetical protein